MTNEDIVKLIQVEDDTKLKSDLYLKLWNNIKRFVTLKADDRARADNCIDYIPDMLQEAFLILPEAVSYYKDDRALFLTMYAKYFMRKAFSIALYGGITKRAFDDPINSALSLDTPLDVNDSESCSLEDMISDPRAEEDLLNVDDLSFWNNVSSLLWEGIELLPDRQRKLLTIIYKYGLTVKDAYRLKVIGDNTKWHYYNTFNTGNKKLLRWLSRDQRKRASDIGVFDFVGKVQVQGYYGGGLGGFKTDHTSVVERMVIKHLDKSEEYNSAEASS